jgi:hypothetical protein
MIAPAMSIRGNEVKRNNQINRQPEIVSVRRPHTSKKDAT